MNKSLTFTFFIALPFLAQAQTIGAGPADTASVLYVGCTIMSMAGQTMAAPQGHAINLDVPPNIAEKLAFYYGQNAFALAPRGWTCLSDNGATGTVLDIWPPGGNRTTGPLVEMQNWSADPAGYAIIAAYGGTYFPKQYPSQQIESMLQQRGDNIPLSEFLVPKFTADQVTYLGNAILAFRTPPNQVGLGVAILDKSGETVSATSEKSAWQSNLPTYGVVGMVSASDDNWINLLAIRLPPKLSALHSVIQDFTAHCQPFDQHAACASQIKFGP